MSQDNGSKPPQADSLIEPLERQVERGSLFTHTALSVNAERLHETEGLVLGLIDVLLAKGLATDAEVADAAQAARQALVDRGEATGPGLMLRVDPAVEPGADPYVPVDCAARMHVCHAVCCRLHFALSADEVESGKVKWDLGQPYQVRHESDGACSHSNRATGGCGIYADRPRVCRAYSCAGDERIWKDFEGMVLNQEWIDANLIADRPRLTATAMIPLSALTRRTDLGSGEPRGPDPVA
jgi:Fe-S-cluster containining protein